MSKITKQNFESWLYLYIKMPKIEWQAIVYFNSTISTSFIFFYEKSRFTLKIFIGKKTSSKTKKFIDDLLIKLTLCSKIIKKKMKT